MEEHPYACVSFSNYKDRQVNCSTGLCIPDSSMTRRWGSIICGRDIMIRWWGDLCRRMFIVEMGQYYLRARYYNPVLGRLMQEASYRGDGLNLYAYCDNNPVVNHDLDGKSKKKIKPGATGGAHNQVAANGGEIHHMPANNASPYGTGAGSGIRMEKEDHLQTNSWGYSKEAQAYR